MATTFKLYADKMGATDPATYIGRDGDIFNNPDTGSLRRSDGTTPGGISIGGGGGGLTDVVDDTTPQLGGPLDINGQQITGNLIPSANTTYDLGTAELRWRDLYLAGNTIDLGGVTISATGGKIDLPAGSTIGGAAADPVTPALAATISEDAVVPVNLTPEFLGGIKVPLLEEPSPGIPIEVDGNLNVNNSISVVGTVDLPGSTLTANNVVSSFTSAGAATVTSLNTHTVPAGTSTLALTSDVPTLGAEDFMDIAPNTSSYNPGATVTTNGSFVQTDEGTPQDIEVSCTVTSGFTSCKVEISMMGWDHTDGTSEYYLELCRIVNGGTPTVLKELLFPNPNDHFVPCNFMHVDVHGASAGDTVAYKLRAKSTATTSFRLVTGTSGDAIYLKELA